MKKRSFPWMLLLVLAAAVLAVTGVSALRGGWVTLPEEETTLVPVTVPPQLLRTGQFRYHYGNLNEDQRKAYDLILERLPGFPESVKFKGLAVDAEGIGRVFAALALDQPLLFHISTTHYKTRTAPSSGYVTHFIPDYVLTREEYEARCEALGRAMETFTVPQGGDDFDCELALHDQLVRRCAYSEQFTQPEKSTAYGAIVEGSASCEGYARAMQLLLDVQGIDCYIVTGEASNLTGFTGGHAWNKARIGGAWYHLDATWDDPVTEDGSHVTSRAYFNLTDQRIGQTHELTDPQNPCTATEANFYVRRGLEFTALDRAAEIQLAGALRGAMETGDNAAELRFTSQAAMEGGLEYLFDRQNIYRVLNNAALAGAAIQTDTVFHADLKLMWVIRILPVKK